MVKTIATLNSTEHRIAKKLNQFTQRLNHGMMELERFNHWYKIVDHNTVAIEVLSVYQLAQEAMRELEDIYHKLLRVVHKEGHIVEFLTVEEFHRIISNATSQLPDTLKILTQQAKKMEIIFKNETLTLYAFFHIIEKPKFTILNAIPLPQLIKPNTFTAIQITNSLMAVDYNNQLYFQLTLEELHQSIRLDPMEYLCSPTVIHNFNTAPNCVLDVIYSRSQGNRCGQHIFTLNDLVWKQLYMPNTWMYVTPKSTRVNLKCMGELEYIWLNNTGIVQINQTCTLETGRNILKSKRTMDISGISSFHKPVELNLKFDDATLHPQIKVQTEPTYAVNEDFAQILHDETNLQAQLNVTTWNIIQPHIVSSGISITIILVIMTAILAIVWVIKKRSTPPTFMLRRQDVQ